MTTLLVTAPSPDAHFCTALRRPYNLAHDLLLHIVVVNSKIHKMLTFRPWHMRC